MSITFLNYWGTCHAIKQNKLEVMHTTFSGFFFFLIKLCLAFSKPHYLAGNYVEVT